MKKLSEMIWDGSKKRPSTTEGWISRDPNTGEFQTCAIAAAMDDAGFFLDRGDGKLRMTRDNGCVMVNGVQALDRRTGKYTDRLTRGIQPPLWFCLLMNVRATPPCGCDLGKATFFEIIPHLHDAHRWTREATAMWVEFVEKESTKYKDVFCPGWGGRLSQVVEVSVLAQ